MRTLVLGLGNPICGDDAVGWLAVEQVCRALAQRCGAEDVEVACCDDGGVGLMERLVGYDHAVLVDAMAGGAAESGQIRRFALDEAESIPYCEMSAHGIGFPAALALGRASGALLPRSIVLIGIEGEAMNEFSEGLSAAVASALPVATQAVLNELWSIRSENMESTTRDVTTDFELATSP